MKDVENEINQIIMYLFESKPAEIEYAMALMNEAVEFGHVSPISPLLRNIVGHKRQVMTFFREFDIILEDRGWWRFLFGQRYLEKPTPEQVMSKLREVKERIKKLREKNSGQRYVCSDCEYKWETRKTFGEPGKCPQCNSMLIVKFEDLKSLLSRKK